MGTKDIFDTYIFMYILLWTFEIFSVGSWCISLFKKGSGIKSKRTGN